jgi:5-methylcytosine-specific restriction endonuclease McrA
MRYMVDEVFNLLGKDALSISKVDKERPSIEVEGFKVYTQSLRYATFYQKGCKCVTCGREGVYFQLDSGDNKRSRRHFNLYAADDTLMTKDHILPKKHCGKNTVDNMQTMCVICNRAKGCELPR